MADIPLETLAKLVRDCPEIVAQALGADQIPVAQENKPWFCLHCKKEIELPPNERPAHTRACAEKARAAAAAASRALKAEQSKKPSRVQIARH